VVNEAGFGAEAMLVLFSLFLLLKTRGDLRKSSMIHLLRSGFDARKAGASERMDNPARRLGV
jgi:hypothetical protein